MSWQSVALLGLAQFQGVVGNHAGHGYKSSAQWLPRVPVGPAVSAEELVSEEALPAEFDWRNINGRNLVTGDWNQHIPQYCGACWIHGTLSHINDRIKIMRGGQFPDIRLGRQSIMNCVPSADGDGTFPGCDGGDPYMIHAYMHKTKVPDETCMPYQGRNMGCSPSTTCRNCLPGDKGCWAVPGFVGYGVSSYGKVAGEKNMMKEIYARGPIVCSFATDGDFMHNYSMNAVQHEGVYVRNQHFNVSQVDHNMEVAGWGVTPSGLKYWVIRNSWGTFWGESGWLKLRRGTNDLLSEADCDWAVPTMEGLDEDLSGRVLGDYTLGIIPLAEVEKRAGVAPSAASLAETPAGAGAQNSDFAVAVSSAFIAGVSVMVMATKVIGRMGVQQQPFILG